MVASAIPHEHFRNADSRIYEHALHFPFINQRVQGQLSRLKGNDYSYFVISVCIPARLLKTIERLCTTILGVQSGKAWQSNEAVCSCVQLRSVYIGRDSTACQAPMDPAMLAAMMVQALCASVWRKHRPPKSNSFLIVRERLGNYVHFDLLFVAISRRLSGMDTHIISPHTYCILLHVEGTLRPCLFSLFKSIHTS